MYKAIKCNDGTWMVCTDGDIICYSGQGDEQAKAQMIADALNQVSANLSVTKSMLK